MTVIAWDGTTLAADKRATTNSLIRTTTKILRVRDCLVGFSGDGAQGLEMVAWYERGADPKDFPQAQRGKDDWSPLLVICDGGESILQYERSPYPIVFEDRQFAIGSGRDFALAAMYCGKTAAEAVEIACHFDAYCGNGVDTLSFAPLLSIKDLR